MRRFASDMFAARNIQFRFHATLTDLPMKADQRRHIFLIFKEAVNNIVRHSDCNEAEICLDLQRNVLVLKIRDNGRGFDSSNMNGGNGLTDMGLRAKSLGGEVNVNCGSDRGTDITLKVPLGRVAKIAE
jgi:signal transduction histidine kinase